MSRLSAGRVGPLWSASARRQSTSRSDSPHHPIRTDVDPLQRAAHARCTQRRFGDIGASPLHSNWTRPNWGVRMAVEARPRESRKTVTVVFSDVAESTRLGEQLDPETTRRIMRRYFDAASRAFERHRGSVEKFIGDAVMAVFGIPAVHEDDAVRAVRAVAELHEAVDGLNSELESEHGVRLTIRTGINTGEVVAGDSAAGQMLVTGDAVNVAARLEQAAAPGEILIGDATRRLVGNSVRLSEVGALELRGKDEGVLSWRLLEVLDDVPAVAPRLDAPLIGRERELAQLEQAFQLTVDSRAPYLFTVLGVAGIGKSRLAADLAAAEAESARVLTGRCLPYGDGITFWPLLEIVGGLLDDD